MDFVHKQNRLRPACLQLGPRLGSLLAQLLHAGCDSVERTETATGLLGDDVGQRCFAAAWRPVEYQRAKPIRCNQPAQQLARPKKVFLPDEFIERGWPHPSGERLRPCEIGGAVRGEQVWRSVSLAHPCILARRGIPAYVDCVGQRLHCTARRSINATSSRDSWKSNTWRSSRMCSEELVPVSGTMPTSNANRNTI